MVGVVHGRSEEARMWADRVPRERRWPKMTSRAQTELRNQKHVEMGGVHGSM